MKVIVLPDELHDYLLRGIIERHFQSGITSEEAIPSTEVYRRVMEARDVDFSNLGPATASISPDGVALELDENPPPDHTSDGANNAG